MNFLRKSYKVSRMDEVSDGEIRIRRNKQVDIKFLKEFVIRRLEWYEQSKRMEEE